jgi:GNAT superfamily N-acetyltransferase
MEIELKTTNDGIDWAELAEIFRLAPLGTRPPDKLAIRFANSYAVCFAFDGRKLISDGDEHAAIYDVVVLPDYQGKGIGRQVMDGLLAQVDVPTVILFAVPGKEDFYRKLGFSKMTTAMARFARVDLMRQHGYIESPLIATTPDSCYDAI